MVTIQSTGPNNTSPQVMTVTDKETWPLGMSSIHPAEKSKGLFGKLLLLLADKKTWAHGQNVLYADGHTSFETQPNIGVDNDNIYTFWSTDKDPTEQDKQGGTVPTGRTPENDAQSEEDSFLVL
jgi:prepilin-type processing-associated H-X9-DG protein